MKFNYKLLSIPIIVLISLFYVNYIFSSQIESLKKQVDNIYFGNFIPLSRLHNIHKSYQDILIFDNINVSKKDIIENWNKYKKQYKTSKEQLIVDTLDRKIMNSFSKNNKQYYKYIITQIELLVEHETYLASIERKEFLLKYNKMDNYLFYNKIFILIILFFLLFMIIIEIIKKQNKDETIKEQYRLDSITDGLTSLYNRKYFDEVFLEIRDISYDNSCDSYFVMLDIDFFKQYNDTYGHNEGDVALIKVSKALDDIFIGEFEYVFRIGGEEFAILLFDSNINYTKTKLDQLNDTIKELNIEHKASNTGILTISMGVLQINTTNYNLDIKELYKLCDAKLYNSKENGRNQYTI
ncbi:MAG: GGDEF domain-containing protein [Campylobacterota bacterium]|nr:GGDEF domain-containing protein [Campylobacterota bacterium]